jgi:hypothetical protein
VPSAVGPARGLAGRSMSGAWALLCGVWGTQRGQAGRRSDRVGAPLRGVHRDRFLVEQDSDDRWAKA